MKNILAILCAALVVALVAEARAACTVKIGGVDFLDSDCDGIQDYTDMTDADNDGKPDGFPVDNCPTVPNGNCDQDPLNCDADGDGVVTDAEKAGGDQLDWNDDGVGDACDDADRDGIADYLDNCRAKFNPAQDKADCTDADHDRIEDSADNCPEIYNPSQTNSDEDRVGDACDICPYVTDDSQDPELCGAPSGGGGNPGQSPGQRPRTNYTYGPIPTHVEGSGGCGIVPAGHASSLLILALAPLMIAALRRR